MQNPNVFSAFSQALDRELTDDLKGPESSFLVTAAIFTHMRGQGVPCTMAVDNKVECAWPVLESPILAAPQPPTDTEAVAILSVNEMRHAAASVTGIGRTDFDRQLDAVLGKVEEAWAATQPEPVSAASIAIHEIRQQILDEEDVQSFMAISQSLPLDFAERVSELPAAGLRQVETDDLMIDGNPDMLDEWDWDLLKDKWNIEPPAGMSRVDADNVFFQSHTWVTDGTKHYDAECPNGVDSFFDLPVFRRSLAAHANDVNEPKASPGIRP